MDYVGQILVPPDLCFESELVDCGSYECSSLKGFPDRLKDLEAGGPLENKSRPARLQCFRHIDHVRVHAQENDLDSLVSRPNLASGLDTVQQGHGNMRHDYVGAQLFGSLHQSE